MLLCERMPEHRTIMSNGPGDSREHLFITGREANGGPEKVQGAMHSEWRVPGRDLTGRNARTEKKSRDERILESSCSVSDRGRFWRLDCTLKPSA